ncbi:oxysterol binding protein [Macrolepiota fuliginosa MF-IS2]|uniref:Oxysterol binding protein n=1 Tax=Macrolepiota fuliginosa MF-IS2 TaxID=1400762 RepID=A0A9P5X7Z6_9AGAR|nr:oxysterol binding protein [Macrolepiota fuliginosa MF-IS2]
MSETAGEAVPAAQRGSWTSFLKSIASFSGDLSSLTAPPFILSPTSLTEFPAYWCERPDLFAAIADAKDNEARAVAILRWFISTLKDQYTSRNESMGSEKKPLNPVLGELFYGHWPDVNGRGRTNILVEQVSHHPPITAYVIENKTKGVKLVGHNAQKTSFTSGSIIVRQIGHAILTVGNQEYLITLPKLRIDGLWYGSPYIELTDTSYIIGGGFISTIEYKGKGYFTGKSHTFKATLNALPGQGGSANDYTVEGLWHEKSKFTKAPPAILNSQRHHGDGGFYDADAAKQEASVLGGESDGSQGEFETRRLWALVAKGIREGDYELASREKSRIENEQRQRRKDEAAAERKWELKHFRHQESDPIYERLGRMAKFNPPEEDFYEFVGNWPVSLAGDEN